MTYDRKDFNNLLDKRQTASLGGQRSNLEVMAQAAVKADLLTGDPLWDSHLTYIQAAIEQTKNQRDAFLETLSDPTIVDDNQTRRIRMALVACNERIGAWKAVMDLPKALMEQGDKAEALLKKLPAVEA